MWDATFSLACCSHQQYLLCFLLIMFSKAVRLFMEIICCILAFCHDVFSPECRIIPLSVSLISSLLSMAVIFTMCSGVFRNTCWNKQILVKIKLSSYNNRHSPAVFLPQSFIHADPAALLNKSEWLASVLSHTYPCSSTSSSSPSSSLPCSLTKEADPHGWLGTCAGVNPNRGAMVTGHGAAG